MSHLFAKRIVHNPRAGIWMSDNGKRAFDKGERPACLIAEEDRSDWEPTIPHHISRQFETRFPRFPKWTRELVMFYRKKDRTQSR